MTTEQLTEERTLSESKPKRSKRKIVLALMIGLAVVELALPIATSRLPLGKRMSLPPPLYILSQTSKSGLVPDDYILLLGDSYAVGGGDWMLQGLEEGGNPPYQATHVLHEQTGRDVINFGRAGSGNVHATAYLASKRFAQLRRNLLGDPTDVIVYFYEGNDLNDNLRRARRDFGLNERSPDSFSDEELDELIAQRAQAGRLRGLPGMLYAPYIVQKFFQRQVNATSALHGRDGTIRDAGSVHEILEAYPVVTPFSVGGTQKVFTKWTQGPALELTDEELAFSLSMLDGSLRWVKQRFEGASVTLVYIPSPLSCYRILGPVVYAQSYEPRDERVDVLNRSASLQESFNVLDVRTRSDAIRERVQEMAVERGVDFIDATSALRAAASSELVHGPIDGNHLNRRGYEILGELLVSRYSKAEFASTR